MNTPPPPPAAPGPAPQLALALAARVDGLLSCLLLWVTRLGFFRRLVDPRLARIAHALEALSALLAEFSEGGPPGPAIAPPAPRTIGPTPPQAAPRHPTPRHRYARASWTCASAPTPAVFPRAASSSPAHIVPTHSPYATGAHRPLRPAMPSLFAPTARPPPKFGTAAIALDDA